MWAARVKDRSYSIPSTVNAVNSDVFLLGKCQNRVTKFAQQQNIWLFFGFGFHSDYIKFLIDLIVLIYLNN